MSEKDNGPGEADAVPDAGGWGIRSAQTVYETPWFRVNEYDAVAPTGKAAMYGLVSFKNLAVGILPLEDDGTTYLVGQHRFTMGRYSWELPEGGGALDDDPILAGKRELIEETGLQAEHWTQILDNMHMSNSTTDERAFAYLAWGLSSCTDLAPDDTEDLTLRRVPVGEAVHMAVRGEITDGFSLVILLKADHLWRTGQLSEEAAKRFSAGQV